MCELCGATHQLYRCGHVWSRLTAKMNEGGCTFCRRSMLQPQQEFVYVANDCHVCTPQGDTEGTEPGVEASNAHMRQGSRLGDEDSASDEELQSGIAAMELQEGENSASDAIEQSRIAAKEPQKGEDSASNAAEQSRIAAKEFQEDEVW